MKEYIDNIFSLNNKSAVVTGCSTGIGQAICNSLSASGADIIGIYYNTHFKETEEIVKNNGKEFYPVKLDMESIKSVDLDSMLDEIEKNINPISILVNNAGINLRNSALEYTMEDWDKVFNINLKSAFFLSQALARRCVKNNRRCKIIQVASLLGFQAGYNTAGYTSSKHGVIGLTKLLANEWGQYGINVNSIVPGYIYTNMTKQFIENTNISERFLKRISLGRWGTPEDIAKAVIFLASSASDYMQGASIVIDGGYLNS